MIFLLDVTSVLQIQNIQDSRDSPQPPNLVRPFVGFFFFFLIFFSFYLFIFFNVIYLFLDRREGREKERERNISVFASHVPTSRDLPNNPGMCPDWESNQWPFASQAGAQSTEPHQPGLIFFIYLKQGCPINFHWGPHQPCSCLQRAEVILGLYKCNCSLTVEELKLYSALWRQPQGWCGPQWKWVWHPWFKRFLYSSKWKL